MLDSHSATIRSKTAFRSRQVLGSKNGPNTEAKSFASAVQVCFSIMKQETHECEKHKAVANTISEYGVASDSNMTR